MINSPESDDSREPMGRHSAEPDDTSGLHLRRDGQIQGDDSVPDDVIDQAEEPLPEQPNAGPTAVREAQPQPASVPVEDSVDATDDESESLPHDDYHAQVAKWRQLSARRTRKPRRKRPWWVELPLLIVVAFLLTFLIQTFVARVYYVPSGSMEQTLHGTKTGGDRILAFKTVYDFRDPKPGEVVVFRGPATWTPEALIPGPTTWYGKLAQSLGSVVGVAPPNEKDFVKRVIAVGGQTVSCCDVDGHVQVDGHSLNEPYIYMEPDNPVWKWTPGVTSCAVDPDDKTRYESYRCFGPYTVPKGSLWVMGDHRTDSADSTYQCRGLVPAPNVHCQGPIPVDDVIGKAVFIVMPPSRWGTIDSPDITDSGGS